MFLLCCDMPLLWNSVLLGVYWLHISLEILSIFFCFKYFLLVRLLDTQLKLSFAYKRWKQFPIRVGIVNTLRSTTIAYCLFFLYWIHCVSDSSISRLTGWFHPPEKHGNIWIFYIIYSEPVDVLYSRLSKVILQRNSDQQEIDQCIYRQQM